MYWKMRNRNNLAISWYTSNWIWKKIKDNRDEKLLVTKSDKEYEKICEWIQYVSEDKESNKSTSRKTDSK